MENLIYLNFCHITLLTYIMCVLCVWNIYHHHRIPFIKSDVKRYMCRNWAFLLHIMIWKIRKKKKKNKNYIKGFSFSTLTHTHTRTSMLCTNVLHTDTCDEIFGTLPCKKNVNIVLTSLIDHGNYFFPFWKYIFVKFHFLQLPIFFIPICV